MLYYTESDEANELNFDDPMALLIGFVLDQQVPLQKAFMGPLVIKERVGSLDPSVLADADLETVFREKPAVHRFPGSMAGRVAELAAVIRDDYDGDASRVWSQAKDGDDLRRRLAALPGFGEMKVKTLSGVLFKRFGVTLAETPDPGHITLGDVDSLASLKEYQTAKRAHKAALRAAKASAAT
jgi:uncharacterized HhH-GPD family protein